MKITKRRAKRLLGLRKDAELAAFFNVRRQAVSQWSHLPELRSLQLRERRPDLFANRKTG